MELKNAVAVCLISLFSATLVVLIAKSLDSQAASRVEPQLAQIVEELRALRGQGGMAVMPGPTPVEAVRDGLLVYYFHGNARCPTCRAIESQAKETVETQFASQLSDGKIVWKTVNYEQDAAGKPLAVQFEIVNPVVVLAKMKDGQVQDWRRLDQVWAVVGDKPAFVKYVQGEIEAMLGGGQPSASTPPSDSTSSPVALPGIEPAGPTIPADPSDLPIPQ